MGRAQRIALAATALVAGYLVVARAVVRALAPRRHRALLAQLLDPAAGPPPGSHPVAPDLAERWAQAVTGRDWDAARELLAEDLHVDSAARHFHGRASYLRGARGVADAYEQRDVRVDEVAGEAEAPHVAWVRFTQTTHGPALEATWWERWTLDPAGERVLEIAFGGVTRLV
ncbi:MAG TPA: nuclear transport factor 2 family protein [Solirubrobacteraceae bacterium]|nr:nuclear transport factor 2 family protein [Solirubrobacteraceae bacterium]